MGILSSIFGCHSIRNVNPNDTITCFKLRKSGGMRRFSGYTYLVEETKEGRVHFLFNEKYPDEKEFTIDDHSVFDGLQQIVLKHKMYKYSGRYKPLVKVLDGWSWDLDVKYASGEAIRADGYMAGPKGYQDAFEEIINYLDQWKAFPAEVNGVVAFDFVYGTTRWHIEPQGDHAVVTIDDEAADRHEVKEKPAEMLEDLRVLANIEYLKENGLYKSDDPQSTPFRIELTYANGDHYLYESFDLNNKCNKTDRLHSFLNRWEINFSNQQ